MDVLLVALQGPSVGDYFLALGIVSRICGMMNPHVALQGPSVGDYFLAHIALGLVVSRICRMMNSHTEKTICVNFTQICIEFRFAQHLLCFLYAIEILFNENTIN
jgi:hypothetical protein